MRNIIKTPDQRLRVFVSSTLNELAPERISVKKALLNLHLIPVMFELGARPYPPRDLYTAYLQQSHLFIGIYWQQYGWVGPDMVISGIEDEFNLSADMPRLIYIKEPAPERAERLKAMIHQISNANVSYKTFSTDAELESLVQNDLALLLTERFELSMRKVQRLDADEPNQQIPIPATTLFGREKVVKDLVKMINKGNHRLITLMGIGGIGKTRVALEVAHQIKSRGAQQVCFVPLDSIKKAEDVPAAILRKVFPETNSVLPPMQLLKELFSDKKVLLVLDNFEQVVEANVVVAELMQQCPHLTMLVTSRTLLRISGEVEYDIRPLELFVSPHSKEVSEFDQLSPAVKLFVSRSISVRPDFTLTVENYNAVVSICRTLDNIPLAIELAAARMRLFSPQQLLPKLEKRFDLLKTGMQDLPERHQTLKAMIDWSFNLLAPAEQRLLCLLSVFEGGCSLEAVGAVSSDQPAFIRVWDCPRKSFYLIDLVDDESLNTGDDSEYLDLVESLLAKSLAYTSVNKYGMLRINFFQTIVQYCRGRLHEFELEQEAYHRHLVYFLFMAEKNWPRFKGDDAAEVYALFDNDIENMTAALHWSACHEPEIGLRLAVELVEYWDTRGKSEEAVKWLQLLLKETAVSATEYSSLHQIACLQLTLSLFRIGRYEEAWNIAEKCAEEARVNNHPHLLVDALCLQSLINIYAGRNQNKESILNEGTLLARQLNYKMMMLDLIQHAASDKIFGGILDEGLKLADESLHLAIELKARRWQAIAYILLGFGNLWAGNRDKSKLSFQECLYATANVNDRMLPIYPLLGSAQIALLDGNIPETLKFLGTVQSYTERPGVPFVPIFFKIINSILEQVNKIPEEERNAGLQVGRKLHLDDAIQMVLQDSIQYQATTMQV